MKLNTPMLWLLEHTPAVLIDRLSMAHLQLTGLSTSRVPRPQGAYQSSGNLSPSQPLFPALFVIDAEHQEYSWKVHLHNSIFWRRGIHRRKARTGVRNFEELVAAAPSWLKKKKSTQQRGIQRDSRRPENRPMIALDSWYFFFLNLYPPTDE